jgi:hypothetical protein
LELRRADLEHLRAQIDDRDNTHVRRELRRSINDHIQNNLRDFSFQYLRSKGISTLHILYIFSILFFGTINIYFAARLTDIPFDIGSNLNTNLLILGLKQTASIAVLVFVVTMYIRFLNRNVKRAADFEFMIRNFQLDIERASWAVETALEWRRDEGGQIPDALLTGVTRDLFKRHDRPDETEISAADSLASALLRSAARAQVDLPFGKLEYDGRGIKKLEKDKSVQ